jgi:TetR/AcrR family transcriptional repressor of nem operon
MMPRTKTAVSLDTKRRIADAALEQFHLKGYNGTSVQDLMSAVGAPKGTFYNHFASKEALALDALRRYGDGFGLEALADAGTGTPRERIDRHLSGLVASGLTSAAERGCLVANLAGEVPAHSPVVASAVGEFIERWVSTLSGAIDDAKAAGELSTDIPSADLAEFIANAWEGGAVKAKATASVEPVRTFERMVARLLR